MGPVVTVVGLVWTVTCSSSRAPFGAGGTGEGVLSCCAPSLRRHDPDQVHQGHRVAPVVGPLAPTVSQPPNGAPLGMTEGSAFAAALSRKAAPCRWRSDICQPPLFRS